MAKKVYVSHGPAVFNNKAGSLQIIVWAKFEHMLDRKQIVRVVGDNKKEMYERARRIVTVCEAMFIEAGYDICYDQFCRKRWT